MLCWPHRDRDTVGLSAVVVHQEKLVLPSHTQWPSTHLLPSRNEEFGHSG